MTSPHLASDLSTIAGLLGSTKPSFWPFTAATGINVAGMALTDLTASETGAAAEALEDDFSPQLHPGGVFSYHFNPTGDHHLAGSDSTDFEFGDGSDDAPCSFGCFIQPNAVATNVMMGKYDSAGNAEEWRFFIDSNSKLSLELHDASASATEIGVTATSIAVGQWVSVVATYDGTNTAPDMTLYINAVADGDGTTAETGSYVAMENGSAPLTVGCSGVTATPVAEFHGRMWGPFITGKELSASEILTYHNVGKSLLGIS